MTSNISVGGERLRPLPFDLVQGELAQIDALLLQEGWSAVEMVREISHHILGAGGKRLRPALLLTAARAVGYSDAWGLKLAACMELLHTATLMHDDVVDQSAWRRGRIAAHERWGQNASILSGDVLFAKAMRILVDFGDLAVLDTVTSAIIRVCEGEVLEIAINGEPAVAADSYLRIIEAKTAALLSACCRVGGLIGNAPAPVVHALGQFGLHLGMAFQIMDDLLDLVAEQENWGKPIGKDLQEGRVTLPLIYTLQQASPEERARLQTILAAKRVDAACVEEVVLLAKRCGGLAAARRDAEAQVDVAKSYLKNLPPSPAADSLEALADYSVYRDR